VTEQDAGAGVIGASSCLGHEGGLAEPSLAGHQEDLATVASVNALGGVGDECELGVSPDDAGGRSHRHAPGEGTVPTAEPAKGSQSSSTVATGSERPFRASSPTGRYSTRAPATRHQATTSAARIWPLSHFAHSRAASITGSPK